MLVWYWIKDPTQRRITEMFQRSFTEDDVDEAVLLEAASDWEEAENHSVGRQTQHMEHQRQFWHPQNTKKN